MRVIGGPGDGPAVDPREYEYWVGKVIVRGGNWQAEAAAMLNKWASDGWESLSISTFENGVLVLLRRRRPPSS
jgi:hypothetical protein